MFCDIACTRHIPNLSNEMPSQYTPRPYYDLPEPAWKGFDGLKEFAPRDDLRRAGRRKQHDFTGPISVANAIRPEVHAAFVIVHCSRSSRSFR